MGPMQQQQPPMGPMQQQQPPMHYQRCHRTGMITNDTATGMEVFRFELDPTVAKLARQELQNLSLQMWRNDLADPRTAARTLEQRLADAFVDLVTGQSNIHAVLGSTECAQNSVESAHYGNTGANQRGNQGGNKRPAPQNVSHQPTTKRPALQNTRSTNKRPVPQNTNQPDNGCSKSNRSKSARDLESNKPSRPSHSRSNSVGDGARRRNKATFHANNASLFDMFGLSDLKKDEGTVHRNWLTDLASQVTTKASEGASRSMLDFQENQHRRRVNLQKSLLEASMHGHDEDDDDDETEAVDFETNILNLDDDEEPHNPEFPRADSPKHGPFKQSVSPIGTSYISSPSSNEGELPSPSKGAATLLKSPPCADQQATTNVDCVTKEDTTNTSAKESTVSESLYCAFETTLDLGADKDFQSVGLTLVPNGLLKSPSIFDLGQHHTQYDDATAVAIAQVEPGSDAEKAGLCPFDFIYTQSAVSDCAQAYKLLVLRLKSTVSDTKMPASTTTTTVQSEITGEAPAESNVLEYDSMGKDDGSKGKTDAWKDHDPLSSNLLDGSGDASLTMHNGSGSDLLEGLEQLWEQGLHSPESTEAPVEVVPPPAPRTGKTLQTLETLSNEMEPTNEPSEETIAVSMTGTKLSDDESNRGSEDNSFNEAQPPPKPSKTVKKSKARPSAGSVPPTLRRSRRQLDLDAEVEAVSNPDEIGRRGRVGRRT